MTKRMIRVCRVIIAGMQFDFKPVRASIDTVRPVVYYSAMSGGYSSSPLIRNCI